METQNLEPTNPERENVAAQNQETANANLPNPEQENVETQNTEVANPENPKSGFHVLSFAITGDVILVSGIVTIAVLAKRKNGKVAKPRTDKTRIRETPIRQTYNGKMWKHKTWKREN